MKPLLPAVLAEVKRQVEPAPAEAAAVVLDRLLGFVDRYGMLREGATGQARKPKEITDLTESLARDYFAALRHLPVDLLEKAISTTITTCRNAFRPPLPAEVAATVEAEFIKRVDLRSRCAIAIGHSQT